MTENIEIIDLVWEWKLDNKYQFTKDGRCFNVQRSKEIKKTLVGYTVGFCLQGKFKSLKQIRSNLIRIDKIDIPF